jgi:hypothetical protein
MHETIVMKIKAFCIMGSSYMLSINININAPANNVCRYSKRFLFIGRMSILMCYFR